ncbi:uncharacterized protein LOC128667000 isoform X2 [Bombina bombina]|uniref:uncharacterized protein LOC128667000 isoform X2 n=1 Tax=Bombina bombina TaxID=8345 RepID=UPI00235A5C3C|nr:uncharacterized protein LOC128667000 isoform X2 [Bombina bombina]
MSYLQLKSLVLSILLLQCCCPVICHSMRCIRLSDYTYKLSENELAGKWTLSASSHEKSDIFFNYIWIDIAFTDGQARIQVVTELNGNIKTDNKEMEIIKENGIYKFASKDKEQSINIYPMTNDEILVTWSGFLQSVSEGSVMLFSRKIGIGKNILDEFNDLSYCLQHNIVQLYNSPITYGELCKANKLKLIKPLDAIKESGRWEMVAYAHKKHEDEAQTLSSVIEFIREGNKVIMSERQQNGDMKQSNVTISEDGVELKNGLYTYLFYETCAECLIVAAIKHESRIRSAYLYTQTGMTKKEELEKFKSQAICEGFTQVHDKRGYGEYPDNCDGYEPLQGKVTISKFLGERSMIFNAYRHKEHALLEPNMTSVLIDYEQQDKKLKGVYLVYSLGSVQRYDTTIFAEEENGTFVWRDANLNVPITVHATGKDCLAFTFATPVGTQSVATMALYCGPNPVTDSDIRLYLRHAVCENYPYVVLRNDPIREVFSCFNFARVAEDLKVEKILGRWNYAVAASNAPRNKPSEGGWISFESEDGKVKYTDSLGLYNGTPVQVNKGILHFAGDGQKHLGTFYETAGDSLLLNTMEGNAASFILFNKKRC